MKTLRTVLPVIFALFGAIGHAQKDLSFTVVPLFEGQTPVTGTVPLLVEMANEGPNARGVVRLSGGSYQMDYPVDLPRGANKRFIAYPQIGFEGLQANLQTNQGTLTQDVRILNPSQYGAQTLLMVSDNPGDMAFVRRTNTRSPRDEWNSQDAYVKPELAPTRPVGYEALGAVVLGAGAERMPDEAVRAISLYALSGGTVVFVGGASSPVLSDPRWAALFPARNLRLRTLSGSPMLSRTGDAPLTQPFSVTAGTPMSGATAGSTEGDVALTIKRPFGLGKAVLLAYNPFEPPLSRWSGRRQAFLAAVQPAPEGRNRAQNYLNTFAQASDQSGSYIVYAPSSPSGRGGSRTIRYTARPGGTSVTQEDPFSTTLPPTQKVLLVLSAYFIVVVPLNFLVLRKLRRGELAWLTAPLISLGFAGILFASASGLYSAKLSTASRGVLIVREGMDEGLFVGGAQMFFPRGGRYDLGLKGIDSLGLVDPDEYDFSMTARGGSAELDPIDVGEIVAPSMRASSLAFREIFFRQRVPAAGWFRIEVGKPLGDRVQITVVNSSPHPLQGANVYVGNRRTPLGEIAPGGRKSIKALTTQIETGNRNWSDGSTLPNAAGSVAVVGTLDGFRPGPQLGQEVARRRRVLVAAFAEEGLNP